jgi:hypothetical protein
VRCFEVCRNCPVKRECLDSVLAADISFTGVYGATTLTERRAAWHERKLEFVADPEFKMPSSVKGSVTGRVAVQSLTATDRRRIASEIGDMFEATFEKRLEMWKQRDAEGVAKRRRAVAATS